MVFEADDVSAMFAYAYDRHRREKYGEERRAHRESLVESMIEWLLLFHDAHPPLYSAAGIRVPAGLPGVDRQRGTARGDGRTDIELEFANARTIVELKVGAQLQPAQLRAYIEELVKDRSERRKNFGRHVVIVTRDGDWPFLDRQLKALRTDGTISPSSGVRVAATTYGRIADADPTGRWRIIKLLADDLAAPRTPVPGKPTHFRKKALADWAHAALVEAARLPDPDFRRTLKAHASKVRSMERAPAGRIGDRAPAFSTDIRNTHAWFHAHGSTSATASPASVEIMPWYLGEPGEGLVTLGFKRKYDRLEVPLPSSIPEDDLALVAKSSLEALWHALWSTVERLREAGWSTPKGQPPVSNLGLLPVCLVHGSGGRQIKITMFFDPRWSTWRLHGPIGIVAGDINLDDSEVDESAWWWLPRDSGQDTLDLWIKWAVDQLVQYASFKCVE